jgi:hypothetical protein
VYGLFIYDKRLQVNVRSMLAYTYTIPIYTATDIENNL